MSSVVLLSGGIDSAVAMRVAMRHSQIVFAITYTYGQLHADRELQAARDIAGHYDVQHRHIDLTPVYQPQSALTGHGVLPTSHATEPDSTYVPARNLIMLAIAVANAEQHGARSVVIGVNADDRAGYVDCRPEFIDAMDCAARNGTSNKVFVWAPLIRMGKPAIHQWAESLRIPKGMTWSCYRGGETPCGRCGACESNDIEQQP